MANLPSYEEVATHSEDSPEIPQCNGNHGEESPPPYISVQQNGAARIRYFYKDFSPSLTLTGTYKTFDVLLAEANNWLQTHPEVCLISCESVLNFNSLSHGFNSNRSVSTRCADISEVTGYKRVLRLWLNDAGQHGGQSPIIGYHNYIPRRCDVTLDDLLEMANKDIRRKSVPGTVIKVENLHTPANLICTPDVSHWTEKADSTSSYGIFLRVFFICGEPQHQELGGMEFIPNLKNRPTIDHQEHNAPNIQIGLFCALLRKAQLWVQTTPDIHIINIVSAVAKYKTALLYWKRCFYKEHPIYPNDCKTGSVGKTWYVQFPRIYYTRSVQTAEQLPTTPHISYKTFQPVQLTSSMDSALKFENSIQNVDRMSEWLSLTGARVMGMETIQIRMYSGGQQKNGPEEIYFCSERVFYSKHEHWLNYIRVYLDGSYMDPPAEQLPYVPQVPLFSCNPPSKSISLMSAEDQNHYASLMSAEDQNHYAVIVFPTSL